MAFDLLRLIKLLHYESITKRKLIWWRFIIISTGFFYPSFLCDTSVHFRGFQMLLFFIYILWTGLIIISSKEKIYRYCRKKKKERSFLSLSYTFGQHIPRLLLFPIPCSLFPFLVGRWTTRSLCAACRDRYARWTRRTPLKAITVTYWIFSPISPSLSPTHIRRPTQIHQYYVETIGLCVFFFLGGGGARQQGGALYWRVQ
jgi:hypothetical protein